MWGPPQRRSHGVGSSIEGDTKHGATHEHTTDKLRNDDATWKDKDMPEAEHTAKPEDYERPAKP
jgi:hypothetical protein